MRKLLEDRKTKEMVKGILLKLVELGMEGCTAGII